MSCTCRPTQFAGVVEGVNRTKPGVVDPRCQQHGNGLSDGDDEPSARVMLATLLDRLTNAVSEVKARIRPWEAGPVAIQWIEHELAPLLAAYVAKTAGRPPSPCPLCDDGEALITPSMFVGKHAGVITATLPCIVEYSCGHRVSIADLDADGGRRAAMPMSSDDGRIPSGATATITRRPRRPIRLDRLIIGNPAAWEVLDIRIGNRSQFLTAGAMPGVAFAANAPDLRLAFETCQTAMDVVLEVRNVSDNPDGEVFSATFMGTQASSEASASLWQPIVAD